MYLYLDTGYLDVLSYLVNDLGADAEALDKEGFNSLHAATQAGETQCVKVHCNFNKNNEFSIDDL